MRFTKYLAAGAVLLGAAWIAAAPAVADPIESTVSQGITSEEILVGAFGPLSGPASWLGLGARTGLNLAIDEINANGGVNGRQLRLIYEGAQTAAESIAAAKKLVEQDKVFVLLLAGGSLGAAAAAEYVREVGVPAYNLISGTHAIHQPFARNVFHGVSPDSTKLADFTLQALKQGREDLKQVAVLQGTYELPQTIFNGLEPLLGNHSLEIVAKQEFDLGAKDFTSQLVAAARVQPEGVILLGYYTDIALLLKQAPEKGLRNTNFVVDPSSMNDAIPVIAGRGAEGLRGAWLFPNYLTSDNPTMQEFRKKWIAANGEPPVGRPNYIDLVGYGDAYVLALALQAAGDNLTWGNLIHSWEGLTDASPSKFGDFGTDVIFPESFSSENHTGNLNFTVIEVKDGDWVALQ